MVKVGDRLSLLILGLCCGGTFIGLALTSIAKKQGQTGPPPKPDWPWLKDTEASFERRLGQLGEGATPGGSDGGSSSGGGGGDKAES
jgi:uncharacterized membrane protein YgcG